MFKIGGKAGKALWQVDRVTVGAWNRATEVTANHSTDPGMSHERGGRKAWLVPPFLVKKKKKKKKADWIWTARKESLGKQLGGIYLTILMIASCHEWSATCRRLARVKAVIGSSRALLSGNPPLHCRTIHTFALYAVCYFFCMRDLAKNVAATLAL